MQSLDSSVLVTTVRPRAEMVFNSPAQLPDAAMHLVTLSGRSGVQHGPNPVARRTARLSAELDLRFAPGTSGGRTFGGQHLKCLTHNKCSACGRPRSSQKTMRLRPGPTSGLPSSADAGRTQSEIDQHVARFGRHYPVSVQFAPPEVSRLRDMSGPTSTEVARGSADVADKFAESTPNFDR